jgi:hypothetical protein
VSTLLLSACTSGGPDQSSAPPFSPTASPPAPSGPITADVTACSKPFSHGKTTLKVAFRLPSVKVPIHLTNSFRTTVFTGASSVPPSSGSASPLPATGETQVQITGPAFESVSFQHATLDAEGEPTVRADSVSALAGKRFQSPFGEARIVDVRTHGSTVVVLIESPQTPADGIQHIGPQAATLQIGSTTLTGKAVSSNPKGSEYVNTIAFTGDHPASGAATLTTSSWRLLDLGTLTVLVPGDC